MQSKVLVLPSWYATKASPTSGSFFREQTALMESMYEMRIAVSEKFWISRQRFLYQKYISKTPHFSPQPLDVTPPHGYKIVYPFCRYARDEDNYSAELESYILFLEKEKIENGFYPNLLHAHSTFTSGILAVDLGKALNIPVVITEHFNPFLIHIYSPFWQNKIIDSLEKANLVLAVSEHQRQNILMHGIRCNPITVGNLVDDKRFFIREKSIDLEKIKFLIVTYYPNFIKDMDTLFKALVMLRNNKLSNRIEVTIVGGGEHSGEYKSNYYTEKIESLGLQKFTKVIPTATRDEMVVLMQDSDALISSSIAESFGVAICEAMLCGKPVLTTANGGINDTVDSDSGIIVKIHDPEALAEGVKKLISTIQKFEPNLIREKIVRKYGQTVFSKKIDMLYSGCIGDFNTKK